MKNNSADKKNVQQLKNKIDTLTKTVSKLRKSDQLTTNAVNYAPIGMITLAIDGKFKAVNRAFCQLVGYTKKELLTINISEITHPDDKYIGNNIIDKLTSGKAKKSNFEKRYIHKNGAIIHAQVSTVILKDDLGTPINFFTQVVDVTKQWHANEALRKSEEQLRLITENTTDNITIVTFDQKATFVYVNPSIKTHFGYDPKDVLGKSFFDFIHPDDKKVLLQLLKKYLNLKIKKLLSGTKTPITETIEFRIRNKNGDWRYLQSTINIVGNQLLAVSRDITERKLAENKLRQSEESYHGLFNNATDAIYIQDKEGRFLDVNEGAIKMYGYPKEYFIGKTPEPLSAPGKNDLNKVAGHLEKAFKGEPQQFEFWGLRSNGEEFPKSVRIQKGKYFEQDVLIAFAIDITESKRAEKEIKNKTKELEKQFKTSENQRIATLSGLADLNKLTKELKSEINEHRKSEIELATANKNLEMLGRTVRFMNECVTITDKKHKIIFVNNAFLKTYGYKRNEIIGKTSKLLQIEENSELVSKIRLKSKLQGWKGELINKKKDGTLFPIELSITPLRNDKDIIYAHIGISSDISERKQVEASIKENEDKLKQAQKIAKLGHYSLDITTGHWTNSVELDHIFGIDTNYKRNLNGWLQIVHPDFQETMRTYFQDNILTKRQKFNREYKIISINTKQEKWVHGLGAFKFDENNNLIEMFGTIHDITVRKKTEEALLKSEIKYRKFFMEDLTGDYLTTREGKIIDCNPQFLNIYGFKSLEHAQKYDVNKLHKSKSERNKFIAEIEKNKILYDYQSDQYKINGEKIIIKENVIGEFDDTGKLINIKGYMFDITGRVQAESEVRKLSTAVEQSPVSIVITDTDGIIEYVNPTFEKITGYSIKDLVGSKPSILKSGVTLDSDYTELWKTITKGKVWVGEFLNRKKNGELFWESATISPIMDGNNNITHFLAVKEDITEQKNIIGELMDREEKYRTLTQNLNTGVYRSSPGEKGKFLEANPAFLKIFGFRNRDELERFKVADLYPDSEIRNKIEEKLFIKGFLMNEETQLRKKDGTPFYASISTTAAKDELGNITHYDGIIEDITERKAMVDQVIIERDKSQLYLDIAGVMFLALDRNGDVILANQKTCEILETSEENIISKNWFDNFIPKEVQLDVKNIFNKLMNNEGELVQFYENEILTANGEKRLIEWRNNVLKDDSGTTIGIISSGLDITERKESEDLRTKLYETSRNLAESLDIDEVLFRMSKQARSLLKCNGVTIYMLEDDKKTLKPVVAYDPPYTKQVLAVKIGVDNSLTGKSIKAKKGKIFNYSDNIKGAFHIKGTPKTDRDNIIVSPLEIDGEIIGALTLVRSDIPFTDRDLSIVNTFAVYGSTAIKNANSHQLLQYEISERMQTEELLKESRDRYESIFDGTVDGIVYTDRKGNILSVNSAFIKITGIKKDELIGKNGVTLIKQLSPNLYSLENIKFIKSVLKGEVINGFPVEFNNKSLELFTPGGKNKPGITILIRDVTERNKARKNILNYQTDLKSLTNELIIAEERAKRRLAVTLHDKLGQYLALANFKTNELSKLTTNSDNKKIIGEITTFIDDAIKESRDITYELSPPVLYEMGLIPAISWKLDEIEKNNKISTSLVDQSKSYEFEKREQIILYRGINELLQNVLKHSKAGSVIISFRLLTNVYRITVTDTGIGFDLEKMKEKAVSEKKFGLFSIIERIKYIGGEVNIDSIPKKGTKVVIDIPLRK